MALKIFFSILSVALLALCISADDHMYPEESIHFGYVGPNGPDKWGSLDPSFKACYGKAQSPVDLTKAHIVLKKRLKSSYHPTNAKLVNNKANIGVHFEGEAGGLFIDGKNYSLVQMHWHTPSEHWLNGHQYDAELHLVHKTQNNEIAVVGVLYRVGRPDPMISQIEDKLVVLTSHGENDVALGTFNMKNIRRRSNKYIRYIGSFTTPPCTEGVAWNIRGKVRSISKRQLQLLKAPLEPEFRNNARPLQPLNGRKIEMYTI